MPPPDSTMSSTDVVSSSSDANVGVIVAPIIIIVVLVLVVVALIIAFYWWRRKKLYNVYDEATNLSKETPYYSTVKPKEKDIIDKAQIYNDSQPLAMYAVPDKKEKRKDTELQRSSVDFNNKPQHSPEMSVRSRNQTISLINPDYEQNTELDIYAAPDIPERTEASTIFDNTDEDNPIYSEAINPSVIIDSGSHDYSSIDDRLCPYTYIYADPLPLKVLQSCLTKI